MDYQAKCKRCGQLIELTPEQERALTLQLFHGSATVQLTCPCGASDSYTLTQLIWSEEP